MPDFDIPWEDNYVGQWAGEPARELHIRKVRDRHYLATLLIDGQPVARLWMDNALTIDMPARYTFTALDGSDFSIDLWSDERFAISLNYEPDFQIYNDPPCEALTVGIARDSELHFLDEYYHLLGGLEHFVRVSHNEAKRTIA
jgi:hypothetical protein